VHPSVVDVSVERDADGALLVRWELAGPPAAVEVAVGPTPEAIDHVPARVAPAGLHELRLPTAGPGPHYVSVAPRAAASVAPPAASASVAAGGGGAVVGGERRVPFEGASNFRDLGGYVGAGGRRVRWGRVFRADSLTHMTAADLAAYDRLGVRAVWDLRTDEEREREPDPFPSIPLSVMGRTEGGDGSAPPDVGDLLEESHGEQFLRVIYGRILANAAPVLGELLGGLAGPDATPAVFHCAGGKDRTGMAAALLLELLGVARPVVLDDYELTSRYRRRGRRSPSLDRLLEWMSPEAVAGVLGTPRWVMEEVLEVLDRDHGGIDAYLTGPAGLTAATLDQLRGDLLA